jgi:hypothetical protein
MEKPYSFDEINRVLIVYQQAFADNLIANKYHIPC